MKKLLSSSIVAAATFILAVAAAGQSQTDPLVTISSPQQNGTYQNNPVQVTVHFSADADAGTFQVLPNGTDIPSSFPAGACSSAGGCDKTAEVVPADLATGDNVITAAVEGPNESASTARTKFQYNSATYAGQPIQKLISGVAVESVSPINWSGSGKDVNNFQIVLGPGPDFPRRTYPASALGCSAGINSVQVLVLAAKSLDRTPMLRLTRGIPVKCVLETRGSLTSFLKSLPTGDLVIAHSFTGLMKGLNMTAIGGTDFTTSSPTITASSA